MAFNNLVDITRLQYFLEKLKALIPSTYASSKTAGGYADKALSVPIATVDSTSTATAFTVQVAEFANETGPRDGMFFYIRNNKVASASGWTLNVNGWGGKPVYNTSAERTTTGFALNRMFPCWYDSTLTTDGCWVIGYLTDTNTTYSTFRNIDHGNGAGRIAHSAVYRYQILFEKDSDYVTPLNNVSNGYNNTKKAMLTDVEFDPFGEIFYWYSSGTVAKDARVRGDYLNYIYGSLDLRYTFNCGTTLTAYKPFYLVVDIGTNGKAKIASTTPWAQELPSTNDGHYYIFLGRTYSTYQMSLYPWHPVYYHDGTTIRQYLPVDAKSVNGHTVEKDVPANAVFTDTTYESKAATSGGTAVSLVTTGEKYTWNNKGTYSKPSGGIPDSDIASAATWNAKGNGTITGIKMNGASKGTSGVVDLGTVITAHQSLSGKQDTLVSGTNIKTINGSSLLGSGNLAVSGLPAVTSSDNDKVLKVVSGAWAAATDKPLYSQLLRIDPGTTHAITVADNVKTLMDSYGANASTMTTTFTLAQSDSTNFPIGSEIAIFNGYSGTMLLTISSLRFYSAEKGVINATASNKTISIPRYGLIAIKKVERNSNALGDAWLLICNPAGSGSMPVNAAVIHVNAPLGSAITFFKDSTVMEAVTAAQTHPNADGKTEDYYYSVPTSDFGSWTVAASKSGENDATQSFSILVAKQYDAFLSYLAPYDFQAVEWLQTSSAPCYFDTGIDITTNSIRTEVYCETVGYGQDYDLTLFGTSLGYAVVANGYRKRWSFCYSTGGDIAWDQIFTYTYTEGTDYHLVYNALGGSVILDDVNVAGSRNRRPQNTRYPRLYIGRYYNVSNGNYYYGQWRYKRFIVSDTSTGEILADFQPCYRKADHVIGFWDHVSNAFFVNLGTGTLTAGPDI